MKSPQGTASGLSSRRAIAYSRFSTKKQERGTSIARQYDAALVWCQRKGVDLDLSLSFEDHGRSGFKGENSRRGALRTLVDMCKTGVIPPGTYLLFEAFDRMTRLDLPEAQNLFTELLATGVVVVTLNNGREWKKKHLRNISDYLLAILDLFRGNQESARKAEILQGAFKIARERGEKWKFASLPGWIKKKDGKKDGEFIVDETLAASVRKVFEMAAIGHNCKAISIRANAEQWPVPNRLNRTEGRWTAGMPRRLLMSRAPLGEHEHKQYYVRHEDEDGDVEIEYLRKGVSTGIRIENYYPSIIDERLWSAAQAAITKQKQVPARQSEKLNFWSGLLFCGHCGAPLRRRQDIKRSSPGQIKGSLQCSSALQGTTDCPPMMFRKFDTVVLSELGAHSAGLLKAIDTQARDSGRELAELEVMLEERRKRKINVIDSIELAGRDVDLIRRLSVISDEIKELERRIEVVKDERQAVSASAFDMSFVESVVGHLYSINRESEDVRAALFLALHRLVEYVVVWPYELALIKLRASAEILTVALPHKSKVPKPQPHFQKAIRGDLVVPALQRPKHYTPRFR